MTLKEKQLVAEFLGYRVENISDTSTTYSNACTLPDNRTIIDYSYSYNLYHKNGHTTDEIFFDDDWNPIHEVIEKIEKIDESDSMYGTLCEITTTYIRIGHIYLDHKKGEYTDKFSGVWAAICKYFKINE